MTIDSAGFYLYMLVVETFTADKIRLRIYAIIGWGKTNQIKKKAIVFLLSFLIAAAAYAIIGGGKTNQIKKKKQLFSFFPFLLLLLLLLRGRRIRDSTHSFSTYCTVRWCTLVHDLLKKTQSCILDAAAQICSSEINIFLFLLLALDIDDLNRYALLVVQYNNCK